ncbi:MAG: RNA polymerase sigma-70 factor [Bacteroidales bacterium]
MKIGRDKKDLRLLCKGDKDAYERIYILYFNRIYIFILRYIISKSLAYDLTQDIFVKIWEKKEQLADVRNLQSYLYRMAKNHTLDMLKHISISQKAIKNIEYHYVKQVNSVDIKYVEKEYFEFLEAAIIDLPERTRIIFKLCREEGRSYKEVAEELGISSDTVKHHMVQSMKTLKDKVSKHFDIAITLFFLLLK